MDFPVPIAVLAGEGFIDRQGKGSQARSYLWTFLILLLLLGLTLLAAFIELGPFQTPLALTIALAKAGLVVLVFMHVRRSTPLTWLFAGAGIFWLSILIGLVVIDYLTRWAADARLP